MNIEIVLKCHVSLYNWPSQMNMCQNLIHNLIGRLRFYEFISNDEY